MRAFFTIIFLLPLVVYNKQKTPQLKEGYYMFSVSYGTMLYEIKGNNVEEYNLRAVKSYSRGEYKLYPKDSIVTFKYDLMQTTHGIENIDSTYICEIKWDSLENRFMLEGYDYYKKKTSRIRQIMKGVKKEIKRYSDRKKSN